MRGRQKESHTPAPYSHSSGVQGEKPDLLSCFDLLISLNKSWDVCRVRDSLQQYKHDTIIDANNFGLTFDKFCDIFKVPLYDPVLSKYISEPGYRALLGPDAISFVENYFKKHKGQEPQRESEGIEDKKEDTTTPTDSENPQSAPLPTSIFKRPPAPPRSSKPISLDPEKYRHANRSALCQAATFAYEEELAQRESKYDRRASSLDSPTSKATRATLGSPETHLSEATAAYEAPSHPKSAFYVASIAKAAKLFALFAKRAPISGQLAIGIPPTRRADVFEIFALLSTVCKGSIDAKARLLFDVFDVDRTHDMSEDELALLIVSVNSALAKLRLVDFISNDEVEYAVSLAFMDGHGRTRQHFGPVEFQIWARSHETPLGILGPLSLLARLQKVIEMIKVRTKKMASLISFDNSSDKVLSRFFAKVLRGNRHIHAILGPIIGKITRGGCSVLLEVNGTVESLLVVMKSGLPKSKNVVHRQKVMLVGNIPSLVKIPEGILEPGCEYKLVFSGFGPPEGNYPTVIVRTPPYDSIISVVSSSLTNDRTTEDMFARMAGSSLIVRLDDMPVYAPEVVEVCLTKLETELGTINFDIDDEGDAWTEEILDSLDMTYAEAIRSVYRSTLKKGSWEATKKIPVLVFGAIDPWLGFSPATARDEYPKAAAFISGILEIVRREYIESLWGESTILAALGANLQGDDQDHLLTLQVNGDLEEEGGMFPPEDSVIGKSGGGIDLGTTKILCLEAPTAEEVIREYDLMKDEVDPTSGKKKQRSFDGKVNFSERQWRKIRRVLMQSAGPGGGARSATGSQEGSFGFEGDEGGEHKNVIFVATFPLLYDPSKSDLEDSFVESGGGGLSTIVSVGESGATGDASSLNAGFSLESLLSGAAADEDVGEADNAVEDNSMFSAMSGNSSPSRRRRKVGSNLDDREEGSLASSKIEEESQNEGNVKSSTIEAIPIPISRGFVLQPLPQAMAGDRREDGDFLSGEGGGFGRDDPPWIGGAGSTVEGGQEKGNGQGEGKDLEIQSSGSRGSPVTPKPASGEVALNLTSPISPESPQDNVAIMVNGKEIGKVRESIVKGSVLQDLLEFEANEKEEELKEERDPFSLQGFPQDEAEEDNEEEAKLGDNDDAKLHKIESVWPDRRPSIYLSLAKSQFISGEVAIALGTLKKCADISKEHEGAVNFTSVVDSWAYKTLLANLANTLQRGSDSLDFQIDSPVEDVIDAYFPEDEDEEDEDENDENSQDSGLLSLLHGEAKKKEKGSEDLSFRAFPLPSHIRKRPRWKQMKVAVMAHAFETSIERLYESGDSDCVLIQNVGKLALNLAKVWGGVGQRRLYRFASILLQKAFVDQHFEQPGVNKRSMLAALAKSHFLAWKCQGVAAEKEHLGYSRIAYDMMMGGDGDAAPTAEHYMEYAETLCCLGKKEEAAKTLTQMLKLQKGEEKIRAKAECRLATIYHRLLQFDEANSHFEAALLYYKNNPAAFAGDMVSRETVGLMGGVLMLSSSMGGPVKGAVERGKEALEILNENFDRMVRDAGPQRLKIVGIQGKTWDHSRKKGGFPVYWKDPRGVIGLAQIFEAFGDHIFSAHLKEMVTELDLGRLGGVFMSPFEMRELGEMVLGKVIDKVEARVEKEEREEREKFERISKRLVEAGFTLSDDDLAIFLAMVSKFLRDGGGGRSVTLVCKGSGKGADFGFTTEIEDSREALNGAKVSFKQICIGRCGDLDLWDGSFTKKKPKKLSGKCGYEGRFQFKHKLAENCQSFAMMKEGETKEVGIRAPDGREEEEMLRSELVNGELMCSSKSEEPSSLVIGPIIGKVTSSSAVILIEVSGAGCPVKITVNSVLIGHTVVVEEEFVKGGRPTSVLVKGLKGNCTYTVCIEGPKVGDGDDVIGRFATMPLNPCAIKFAVVNGNKISSKEEEGAALTGSGGSGSGSPNLWDWVARDLRRDMSPTSPDFILHLGAQVDVKQAYDESRLLLDRYRKANPKPAELPSDVHEKMRNLFRQAYRVSWGRVPNVREVLGGVSNIMVCGISDVMGTIIRQSQLEFDPEIAAVGLQVAREYQMKLLDINADIGCEDELENLAELTSTRKDNLISSLGHFHRFGRVGVLCIDSLSSNLFASGRNVALPLISAGQLQWLTRVVGESEEEEEAHREFIFKREQEIAIDAMKERRMKKDESDLNEYEGFGDEYGGKVVPKMHSLVVSCEQPFVWYRNEDARKFVSDPRRVSNGSAVVIKNSFSYHIEDCGKLLSLLFAWKQKYPGRDVLIVCGSCGMGSFNTEITDVTTGLKIRQWAVSGVTTPPKFSFDCELEGTVGSRFEYVHTPLVGSGDADGIEGGKGLYERMKEMRKEHKMEMSTLELEHEIAMVKREERLEMIASGEIVEGEDEERERDAGDRNDDEEGVEGRPKTPQEKRKERDEAEEKERSIQRDKELQIAAQALTSGGDMFEAMEKIAGSRPNTRDGQIASGSRPGTRGSVGKRSRPGTSGSQRARTPKEIERDELDGPLREDRIWETIRRVELYKRKREMGYLAVSCAADTEQPNFFQQFVTPGASSVEVTVGPVIGEVSHSGAKVLLEVNGNLKVRCFAQKLHDKDFFDYEEMEDLAAMQFKVEEMELRIAQQEDYKMDSDPIVIADCEKTINDLSVKIKSLADKLMRVKTVVRTVQCEANKPCIFEFEEGSLESGSKYWISFEPFGSAEGSFTTLPERASTMSISCVSGLGKFDGLLPACTPAAYDTWRGILGENNGGGGRKFERLKIATRAATSYNKFGNSVNPLLEDDEVLAVYSSDPNTDFEVSGVASVGEETPRMTKGWYGGASGVGMGGERGLGAGGNVTFLLDKGVSRPRRAYDLMICIGGCGVMDLFGLLNGDKFMLALEAAVGLKKKGGGGSRGNVGGRKKKRLFLKPKKSSNLQEDKEENKKEDGSESERDGGFDLDDFKIKTIKDDAFLGFSEDESDDAPPVTETTLSQMDRDDGGIMKAPKGEDYVYRRPRGGEHVEGSGGVLGNEREMDDWSLLVRESDASIWPPEDGAEGRERAKLYGAEEDAEGYTEAMRVAKRECLDMLKNAYRSFYSLPLHSNIVGNVARICMFSPDDIHRGLEGGLKMREQDEFVIGKRTVPSTEHPLIVERLRKLSVEVWKMYCGDLRIEPIREREIEDDSGVEVSMREAMRRKQQQAADKLKPPHQGRFLNMGNTSVLMLDVKSRRCVTEDGLWGPMKERVPTLELLSEEQWRFLRKCFNGEKLKRSTALVVVCETCLVTEDVFMGTGVDHSRRKSVSFEMVEKKAEKEGKKLSKKKIEEERQRLLKEQRATMGLSSWYCDQDVTLQWGYHLEEQNSMLKLLFDWLEGSGSVSSKTGTAGQRSVVVMCGGGRCGVETLISDRRTGNVVKQVCTGTVGDYCRPFDLERKGVVPGSNDMYVYEHVVVSDGVTDDGYGGKQSAVKDRRRLVRGWSYGELEILSEPYDARIRSKLLCRYGGRGDSARESICGRELRRHTDHLDGKLEDGLKIRANGSSNYIARKLVGPVIGKVDVVGSGKRVANYKTGGEPGGVEGNTVSARVLLELDSPALVTLQAINVLTGERHVSVKRVGGRIPAVFILDELQQGRRYYCEWFGFEKSDCEESTFCLHTPLDDCSDFVALLVSGDKSDERDGLGKDEESIWGVLADRVEDSWHGTDVCIHLGGQSGSRKDEAFLECMEFVRSVEERKEKAALEFLGKRMRKNGGKRRKALEDKNLEAAKVAEEKAEVEACMREAVPEEEDEAMDAEVRERFRVELRADWNAPSKARTLKCVSNVMMRGGSDIYSKFSRHVGGCMGTAAGRRVARLAEEVNREYMRQLWDSDENWFEEPPHNGFFTTWRGGQIGALFVDARECLDSKAVVSMDGELENVLKGIDHPLISDNQWKFIKAVLSRPNLSCLLVTCELPFVWEGKEAAKMLGRTGVVDGEGNYIQDHWSYRNRQLVHLLQTIFDWRAEKKGRSVQLIGGSGSESCCGFTTRVTQKLAKKVKKGGGEGGEEDEAEKIDENDPPEKDFMQIAVPPVTGKASKFIPKWSGILGQFGYVHSPLPKGIRGYGIVECTVENGDTGNDADVISTVEARLVGLSNANQHHRTEEEIQYDTRGPEDFDGTLKEAGDIYKIDERVGHPKGMYSRIPVWWYTWSSGMPSTLFQDEVYLRARESQEHVEARVFVEKDGVLAASIERSFVKFHLDDQTRPSELRTMNVGKMDVLVRQIYKAVNWLWDSELEGTDHKFNISYLKDDFVFHYLMRKCATEAGDGLKDMQGWVKFIRSMLNQAGIMRMAVLCQHHQEWLDRTRLEREGAARAAEIAKMKAAKEAWEKWLKAEEARLNRLKLDNKLDEYQLKTVEKKQKEREWEKKEEEMAARMKELEEEDKGKVDKEQKKVAEELAKKEEEEKIRAKEEQDEMNRLAEEDEEEYNRRLEAMTLKQAEEIEKAKEGENIKRRRLARERKQQRREGKLMIDLPTLRPKRKVVL